MPEPAKKTEWTVFLLLPFTLTLGGFVIMMLWSWFVVPLGARPIGIAHAVGLDLLAFTVRHPAISSSGKSTATLASDNVAFHAVCLGLAWVAHYAMMH
ncbi:MAG: hypothetical protein ACHREM_01165 [Polyangiales bacterium]